MNSWSLSHRVLSGTNKLIPQSVALYLFLAYVAGGGNHSNLLTGLLWGSFIFLLFSIRQGIKGLASPIFSSLLILFVWSFLPFFTGVPVASHLQGLSRLSLFVAITLFLASIRRNHQDKFFSWVVLLSAFESLAVLYNYWVRSEQTGILKGNPLYSGLFIASGLLLQIGRAGVPGRWGVMALQSTGLLLTFSRGSLLGLVIAGLCMLSKNERKKAALGMGVLIALFAMTDPDRILAHLKLDIGNSQSAVWGRFVIWKTAVSAILDRWLLGFGFGNFENAYLLHQYPSRSILRYGETTIFAHNDYLQLAVSVGLPGLLILVWGIFKSCNSLVRNNLLPEMKGPLAVLILFGISAIFNFSFYHPLHIIVSSGCLGFLIPFLSPESRLKKGGQGTLRLFLVAHASLALLMTAVFVSERLEKSGDMDRAVQWAPFRNDLWYNRALQELTLSAAKEKGSVEERDLKLRALSYIDASLRWNRENAFAWGRKGLVLATIPDTPRTEVLRAFQTAHRAAPAHAPFYIDEGLFLIANRQPDGAKACFLAAARLEPLAPRPYFGLAMAYHLKGDPAKALVALKTAQRLKSRYQSLVPPSNYADYLFNLPTHGLL